MAEVVIDTDDPRSADVRALLARHLDYANSHSPPSDVHALDIDGLLAPAVTFCSARSGAHPDGALLGVGALRLLDPGHGEVKSMHTAEAARGRGVGRAMLEHLLGLARERGLQRVSLETGTMPAFAPARALYAQAGFVPCPPFAGYHESPNSVCLTLPMG